MKGVKTGKAEMKRTELGEREQEETKKIYN